VFVLVTQTEESSCFAGRASKLLKWRFNFLEYWLHRDNCRRFTGVAESRSTFTARIEQYFLTALRCLDSSTGEYLPSFRMKIIPATLWSSRPRILLVSEGENHYGTSKRQYLFVIRLSVTCQTTLVFSNTAVRQ